jgi:hypothetical protein
MSKLYIQGTPTVWESAASLGSSASSTSGSFLTQGYARIVGMLITSGSLVAASGVQIWQSGNRGSNWDYRTESTVSACSGSAFSIEVIGNAAKIEVRIGANDASVFRTWWGLRPV